MYLHLPAVFITTLIITTRARHLDTEVTAAEDTTASLGTSAGSAEAVSEEVVFNIATSDTQRRSEAVASFLGQSSVQDDVGRVLERMSSLSSSSSSSSASPMSGSEMLQELRRLVRRKIAQKLTQARAGRLGTNRH